MAYNLFPDGYENEVIESQDIVEERAIGYKNGVYFDYEQEDFPRDGKYRLLDGDGTQSWESWCINCLLTERYKHLAYSADFGVEWDAVFAATSREEAESVATRQITEALLADPYGRTKYVDSIEFDWYSSDSLRIFAKVHGIENVTIDITAYITKGE